MPMLTVDELLSLVALDPAAPGAKGKIEGMRRRAHSHQSVARSVLDEIREVPRRAPAPQYQSPLNKPLPLLYDPDGGQKVVPFTASDVAWLQRLPADPAAIRDSEIEQLMHLVATAEPKSGDARLVGSIFKPVQQLHARRRAEAQLAGVRALPVVEVPRRLKEALAQTIQLETPDLHEDEVGFRSSRLLAEAIAVRDKNRSQLVESAEKTLADINKAVESPPAPVSSAA
jgi:hypothetical protein